MGIEKLLSLFYGNGRRGIRSLGLVKLMAARKMSYVRVADDTLTKQKISIEILSERFGLFT